MLRSVGEHSDEVRTDPLQVLHIVYNLNEILSLKPAGVGHTLNDSQLKDQVTKRKYFEMCLFVCKVQRFIVTNRLVICGNLSRFLASSYRSSFITQDGRGIDVCWFHSLHSHCAVCHWQSVQSVTDTLCSLSLILCAVCHWYTVQSVTDSLCSLSLIHCAVCHW